MLKQICIKCGKAARTDNLCEKCFLQRSFLEIENFRLILCSSCSSYYENGWHSFAENDHDDMIKGQIANRIKSDEKIIIKDIFLKTIGNRIIADVSCSFVKFGKRNIARKEVIIIVKKQKCDKCVKLSGGYYEAILQIRGGEADNILNKVNKILSEAITSINKVKNGYDIKIMDKGEASKVMGLGRDIKKTYKLVGEKKGKRLIRDCYSIR